MSEYQTSRSFVVAINSILALKAQAGQGGAAPRGAPNDDSEDEVLADDLLGVMQALSVEELKAHRDRICRTVLRALDHKLLVEQFSAAQEGQGR